MLHVDREGVAGFAHARDDIALLFPLSCVVPHELKHIRTAEAAKLRQVPVRP